MNLWSALSSLYFFHLRYARLATTNASMMRKVDYPIASTVPATSTKVSEKLEDDFVCFFMQVVTLASTKRSISRGW
jgi:hypothetical protein